MSSSDFILAPLPTAHRHRELWLQHAAGFIFFEDVRGYAIKRLDPVLDETARAAALKAIDDAVYGLMMVLDGVTGGLGNSEYLVHVEAKVCLTKKQTENGEPIESVVLSNGDGMCMGYHRWLQGDFGEDPTVTSQVNSTPTM
jgi:hypothetical protein